MKTLIKEITLYKFSELDEKTQEKILSTWRENDDFSPAEDLHSSLKKFCSFFPVKIRDFEYGYRKYINFHISQIDFYYDDEIKSLSGVRLLKYIYNNYYSFLFTPKYLGHKSGKPHYSKCQFTSDCVLTGMSYDHFLLDPIYTFLKNPLSNITLEDLLSDCVESWLSGAQREYEYWSSEEGIREEIEANDYDFTEEGKIY